MLPSMRYRSAKLTQLVHQKQSYHLHVDSVDKIMSKSSNQFLRRSQQLTQLKHRKIQAYNHSQNERSREILHINALLFCKIRQSAKKDSHNQSFEDIQEQIQQRNANAEKQPDNQNSIHIPHFVLRNHRQSPIHKSTLLERTQQNNRLARKIVKPQPTYSTSEYQKLHLKAEYLKSKIMKYEPQEAKTKAELYVRKRLNSTILLRRKSMESQSSRSYLNPESPLTSLKLSQYLNKRIK